MFTTTRTLRWPVIALCFVIILLLFSASFDRTEYFSTNNKLQEFDASSFISQDFNKQLFQNLQVQEPELNMTEVEIMSNDYDIAATHPPLKWTEKDLEFFKTAAGETVFSQLAVIPEAHEKPNFSTITTAERLFKALFMYFDKILAQDPLASVTNDPRYKDSWELYKRLESTLYPWMYPYWQNAFHINNQTFNNDGSNSKGIVLCVGNAQFKFAASTIRSLREVLNCDLPIEIFYIRDDDLSAAKRSYLESEFSNVTLRKLEDYVSNYYTRFGGWAMKPFAMLASRFTELIMMDADVFFLQSPSTLFVDKGYQTTGSLFFYDRTLFPDWEKGPDWMRSFLPTMSTLVPNTRWFKGLSSHEQESGVVVIDKRKSLLGLLSTCKMNGITERDEVVYKHVHGDKETFWVGFEVMQTPYAFVKSFGAVIGGMGRGGDDGEPDQVCGVQLHLDPHDKPLWFNGGLYRNKHARPVEYLNFTHFSEGNDWEFSTHCIRDTDKIRELDPEQRKIALASVEIDKQRVNDEKLLDEGKWRPKNYDSHH